jgi:hypothetical protein
MERPILISAIHKLALAGEQAGFSVEQMIQMLNEGLSVEELITLIGLRIEGDERKLGPTHSFSWVM